MKSKAQQNGQGTPQGRARFWLMLASGCVVASVVWLMVIETANMRADLVLQRLHAGEIEPPWANIHADRDALIAATGLTEQDAIDSYWAEHQARNRLYRLMLGFGPMAYLLSLAGIVAALGMVRQRAGRAMTIAGTVFAVIAAAVLIRCFNLGVLQYGLFDYLWNKAT